MENILKRNLTYKLGIKELLENWGFKLLYLIAGAIGGLLMVLKKPNRKKPWWEKLLMIFTGTVVAGFLTPLISEIFHINEDIRYSIAFLLGYMGLQAVDKIIDYLKNKKK